MYVSVEEFQLVNKVFVHMDTHLSNRWVCSSAMAKISLLFTGFIPAKTE
jgi:hypothetical protein